MIPAEFSDKWPIKPNITIWTCTGGMDFTQQSTVMWEGACGGEVWEGFCDGFRKQVNIPSGSRMWQLHHQGCQAICYHYLTDEDKKLIEARETGFRSTGKAGLEPGFQAPSRRPRDPKRSRRLQHGASSGERQGRFPVHRSDSDTKTPPRSKVCTPADIVISECPSENTGNCFPHCSVLFWTLFAVCIFEELLPQPGFCYLLWNHWEYPVFKVCFISTILV